MDLVVEKKLCIEKFREKFPNGVGHICQFASGSTLTANELISVLQEIQEYMQKETKSKIPVLFHEEAITGVAAKGAAITPQMIGMACSWKPELVYDNAVLAGENLKKMG